MKKLIIAVVLLGLCSIARAESLSISETLKKVPLKQGVAYDLKDGDFSYLSTIEVASYKGVTLEVGTIGETDNSGQKIAGVISYPVLNLKKLGVTLPILDLVDLRLGVYCSVGNVHVPDEIGNDTNVFSYGISGTAISLKF